MYLYIYVHLLGGDTQGEVWQDFAEQEAQWFGERHQEDRRNCTKNSDWNKVIVEWEHNKNNQRKPASFPEKDTFLNCIRWFKYSLLHY